MIRKQDTDSFGFPIVVDNHREPITKPSKRQPLQPCCHRPSDYLFPVPFEPIASKVVLGDYLAVSYQCSDHSLLICHVLVLGETLVRFASSIAFMFASAARPTSV